MAGELQRFKTTLVYEAQAPAEQLLADLGEIREFDKRSEGRLRIYAILFIVAMLITVASFFLKSAIGVGAGIVGILVVIVLRWRGSKFDLANRRFELAGELVRILSRDISRAAALDVSLNLIRPNDKRKRTGEGYVGPWTVTYYSDPWLRISGRFADGTAFRIAVVEKYQSRSKWKRSASGKSKAKHKSKAATQASVRLIPKRKRYQHVEQVANQAKSMLLLPGWARVKKLNATPRGLALSTTTDVNWTVRPRDPHSGYDGVELVAKMLLSLYQVLHVSAATASR